MFFDFDKLNFLPKKKCINILEIKITEYQPFAIRQDDKQKYIADKTGHMIKIDNQEEEEKR